MTTCDYVIVGLWFLTWIAIAAVVIAAAVVFILGEE